MAHPISWNEWSFEWEVKDKAGLGLRKIRYKGTNYIYKASLPVIRVKSKNDDCGPYNDRIKPSNLAKFTDCNNQKVCAKTFSWDGTQWLDIRVGAHIGAYRIQQAWQLSRDGRIAARVWSRGVSCDTDHVHHPYWRIDFDVNGHDRNELWRQDGASWVVYTREKEDDKKPGRRWLVRNSETGHAVWIIPGQYDGKADWFSRDDLAVRRYHSSEDEPWPFGCYEDLGYDNDENVRDTDIVVWYIAHLFHEAHDEEKGSLGEWVHGGPVLEIVPSQLRAVGICRSGDWANRYVIMPDLASFTAETQKLFDEQGLRMIHLDTFIKDGKTHWAGICRSGDWASRFLAGMDWSSFSAKAQELFDDQGLRLICVAPYIEGGELKWAGMCRSGNWASRFLAWLEWPAFAAKVQELFNRQGLRPIDVRTYRHNGKRYWTGICRSGDWGCTLIGPRSWSDFSTQGSAAV